MTIIELEGVCNRIYQKHDEKHATTTINAKSKDGSLIDLVIGEQEILPRKNAKKTITIVDVVTVKANIKNRTFKNLEINKTYNKVEKINGAGSSEELKIESPDGSIIKFKSYWNSEHKNDDEKYGFRMSIW
jgi:hypothetical protein